MAYDGCAQIHKDIKIIIPEVTQNGFLLKLPLTLVFFQHLLLQHAAGSEVFLAMLAPGML